MSGIGPGIVNFNSENWAVMLGTVVFAFEGIGMILPINAAMKTPENFPRVLSLVMFLITTVLLVFAILSYLAFGTETKQVILLNLPNSGFIQVMNFLYSLAIAFSVPLFAFPALKIIENSLIPLSGKRNVKRKWFKNLLRSCMILSIAVLAFVGSSNLDKFVSLIGGFCCVPLSFVILKTYFRYFLHYFITKLLLKLELRRQLILP